MNDKKIHSFLLIGQSNMAGRGDPREVEPIKNDRLYVLRNGGWQHMYVPVNPDRPFSGTSLAESFADRYSKEYGVDVGLIPCAEGNSSLNAWNSGGVLYDHAVFQTQLAKRSSVLKGILWHQGEADCGASAYPLYYDKFSAIVKTFRKDLCAETVPFLCGALGTYLKDCPLNPDFMNYDKINEALQRVTRDLPHMGYVSSDGLTPNPDVLHFNAPSLRCFGERYFEEYQRMTGACRTEHIGKKNLISGYKGGCDGVVNCNIFKKAKKVLLFS